MSLSKPEINYDTALYALQENVVLKQRLEEDKQQYIKRLEEEEDKISKITLELNRVRYTESVTEDKLDKALYDVTYLQQKLAERVDESKIDNAAFAMLFFLVVDFMFNIWLFCQIPFTK